MKKTNIIVSASFALALIGTSLSPLSALAKKDDTPKKARFETHASTSVDVKMEKEKSDKWYSHFFGLLNRGAGKSGKTPRGLEHAPGIQKKLRLATTTVTGAPALQNITVNTSSSTARINWYTNQLSSGKIYFSTSSPVSTSSPSVSQSNYTRPHSITLSNLTSDTVYYYLIESANNAGSTTLSSQLSFKTSDVTAPTINSLNVQNVSSTSAKVVWTTNEPATGKIGFGIGNTNSVISTSSLSTSHEITLSGLLASTTYNFVVSSADASGNIGASNMGLFTTTQ
jgi:hypothetical protein